VQASCAIEEMFTPVRIRGMQYVDADQVMPLPVRLAREWVSSMQGTSKETARVLAMDASARPEAAPPGAERFRESDLRKRALIAQDAPSASLMLHPEMSYFVNVSQAFRLKTIEQGYQQTLARAEQIKAALNSK
jgi:NTE family protein